MSELVIISDVHGKYSQYKAITDQHEYTLQVGDMGLDYQFLLDNIDPHRHKFFSGNHDNYDQYSSIPHSLGKFGNYHHVIDFFYIRGAFSIDWRHRVVEEMLNVAFNEDVHGLNKRKPTKLWWEEEQLNYTDMLDAYTMYTQEKPEIMITHSLPSVFTKKHLDSKVVTKFGYNPDTFTTNTQELLTQCFDFHQPRLWIGGHFHQNFQIKMGKTTFICREELGKIRLDKNGELR